MPLWKIYHPEDAFSDADKKALANAITDIYATVMPRFYVCIVFEAIAADDFYVGGEPSPRFVRITMDHIARSFTSIEMSRGFLNLVNKVVAPYIADRGYNWELHIDETPFDYWTVNGYFPPPADSEDERRWREENRPSARTHD